MQPTHTIAMLGDMLLATVKIGADIHDAVHADVPADVADAWDEEGSIHEVVLSVGPMPGLDANLIYSGSKMGYLPDDYDHAYEV